MLSQWSGRLLSRVARGAILLNALCVFGCTGDQADDVMRQLETNMTRGATPALSVRSGECPLSSARKRKAVDAFKQLMPVITHPRCSNCHGGINVFDASAKETHVGGQITSKDGHPITANETKYCDGCHDYDDTEAGKSSPWRLAPFVFAGRSQAEICTQFQLFSRGNADEILDHLSIDPLIEAGFEGKRGNSTLDPEPPPMGRAMFVSKARAWLEAMDGIPHLPGEPGCGCTLGGGGYRVTYEIHLSSEKRALRNDRRYVAELYPDPTEEGALKGEGRYTALMNAKNANCRYDDRGENEHWYSAQGKLEATGAITVVPSGWANPAQSKTKRKTSSGGASEDEFFSVLLTTMDWPILPFFGGYATGADKDSFKTAGSEAIPLVKLTGETTTIHNKTVSPTNDCNGNMTAITDVTIQKLP